MPPSIKHQVKVSGDFFKRMYTNKNILPEKKIKTINHLCFRDRNKGKDNCAKITYFIQPHLFFPNHHMYMGMVDDYCSTQRVRLKDITGEFHSCMFKQTQELQKETKEEKRPL